MAEKEKLIQVRCCAYQGEGAPEKYAAAAAKLVAEALDGIDTYHFPPQMLMLLATPGWCDAANSISQSIRAEFQRRITYQPPLVGASAPMIFCSMPSPQVVESGVVLMAMFSAEIRMCVEGIEKPFDESVTPEARKKLIRAKLSKLNTDRNQGIAIGVSAQRALLAFLPGCLPRQHGDWVYRDGDLCNEIVELSGGYSLFAASAASEMQPSVGYQFADNQCLKSGLAFALLEHDLKIGSQMVHGLTPSADGNLTVEEFADPELSEDGSLSGFLVSRLSDENAQEAMQKVQPGGELRGPVGVRRSGRYEINVPFPTNLAGVVRFKNRLHMGDVLTPMEGSRQQMEKECIVGAKQAVKRAAGEGEPTAFLMEFAGASRHRHHQKQGTTWGEIAANTASRFPGTPYVGALCAGEFVDHRPNAYPANAFSVWHIAISAKRNFRGESRAFLKRIQMAAADSLLQCSTPQEVMEAALRGAIDADAEGGCISRLNAGTQKILGGEGKALNKPGSTQNWELALERLAFRAPGPNADTGLPCDLAPWAIPALAGTVETKLCEPPIGENILEIISRTRHALFLPKPDMFPQYRLMTTVEAASLQAQLAIPLIGLRGLVIGTLQLGFPLNVAIDNEVFQYWLGFAQKVAVSLERAEEIVQREELGRLTALQKEYSQRLFDHQPSDPKPADPSSEAEEILAECVRKIQDALEADYAHARVAFGRQQFYSLIAPNNDIGRWSKANRPALAPNSGSCRDEYLADNDGYFVNEHGNPDSASAPEDRRFESFGVIPLTRRGMTIGSFVVESRKTNFFTDHRKELARSAARIMELILLDFEGRLQRDRLHALREGIVYDLIEVLQGGNWTHVLDLLRRHFCVDHATIFINYEERAVFSSIDVDDAARLKYAEWPEDMKDPEVLDEGHAIVAPLLSPENLARGVLWLRQKNRRAKDDYTFGNSEERDAVLEIARYIASAIGFRAHERKINQFVQKLERQGRLVAGGLFAAQSWHGLTSPLSSIQRSVDVLRMSPEMTTGEREQWYRYIVADKNRAESLIQAIAHRRVVSKSLYPINEPVKIALDLVADEKEFPLVPLISENKIDAKVEIELLQIVWAIQNLVANALHAASKDGGAVAVFTKLDSSGSSVEIHIHNSGRIYTAEQIAAFSERGETDKKDRPHMGIGLMAAILAFFEAGGACALAPGSPDGVEAIGSLPIQDSGPKPQEGN